MAGAFASNLLSGKTAFITGGGSGICRGIARAFLAHGAKVAIVSRKVERLEATASELAAETKGTCLPLAADVRDYDAVTRAIEQSIQTLGALDIVVNGAAGNFLVPAAALSSNGFRTVMDIDAAGTFNVSRAAFEAALSARGGNIINISATLHYGATPMQVHAAAAKAAVDSITRSLALEWGGVGVRVNGIAPGPIDDTEGMRRLATPEIKKKLESQIPIGRYGRIDEIANVALFLASDLSSLIHGATLVADGGAWLTRSASLMLVD